MRWLVICLSAFILCTAYNYAELNQLQILVHASRAVPSTQSTPNVLVHRPPVSNGHRTTKNPSKVAHAPAPSGSTALLGPSEPAQYARLDQATRLSLSWVRFWKIEALILIFFLVAVAIYAFFAARFGADVSDKDAMRSMQLLLILVGVGGSLAHIFWTETKGSASYVPAFDLVALGWVALALLGFLLPRLEEFGFAGATFKLKDTIKNIGALTESATELLRNWAESINLLAGWLVDDPVLAPDRIFGFIRDRAGEATEWLSAPGDDGFMLSVWNYDQNGLQVLYPKKIGEAPVHARIWRVGEGCLGQAFLEQRLWNEKNAKALPAFVPVHNEYQDYKGILLVPIRYENQKLGMLCVRRKQETYFAPEQENVACALAQVLAYAMGSAAARSALKIAAAAAQSKTPG
ncbi:MAG TPA: GAF domain-containing protein [Candidatus Rubrimentiphilum sp.]|nr:GAF domain-containing protein [Candidatus Rubrimentiphilum sp.]